MLIEKALDPAFWQAVRTNGAYAHIVEFITKTHRECRWDAIPATPYRPRFRFYSDGDRSEFEGVYFRRRKMLAASALLALIYPEEEVYLEDLHEIIWAICDEYSWVLPAHTKGGLEEDQSYIDLFSAETGFSLAEIDYLLADRIHPRVRHRVRHELERRIIRNFLTQRFGWETCRMNWASVCGGNVGGVLMYQQPETFRLYIPRFISIMDSLIEGFAEDGTCLEGFGYWQYGFGNYVWFADLLYQFTQGQYDLLQGEKVERIAGFMQRCFLKGGATVSFADGTRSGKADPSLQLFLSRKFPSVHTLPKEQYLFWPGNVMWMQTLRNLLYLDPDPQYPEQTNTCYDLPDAQQVILQKDRYALAIKGGFNDEPHNHNDVGSFILATDKGQILCDYGAGKYTRQYFQADTRYTMFVNSSLGHSVPIINGTAQGYGAQFRGTLTHEGNRITVDMTKAYPLELRQVIRCLRYEEDRVTLTDSFDEGVSVTERFVTLCQPEISEGRISLDGTDLCYDPQSVIFHWHTEEIPTKQSGFARMYVLDFDLKPGIRQASFTIFPR